MSTSLFPPRWNKVRRELSHYYSQSTRYDFQVVTLLLSSGEAPDTVAVLRDPAGDFYFSPLFRSRAAIEAALRFAVANNDLPALIPHVKVPRQFLSELPQPAGSHYVWTAELTTETSADVYFPLPEQEYSVHYAKQPAHGTSRYLLRHKASGCVIPASGAFSMQLLVLLVACGEFPVPESPWRKPGSNQHHDEG